MLRPALIVAALLALLASGYSFLFSATAHYRHQVQLALDGLAQAVETQDAAKVHAYLESTIHEFAHISLEVHFSVPGQNQKAPPPELFGKTEFLSVIDNTLYSVNNYHFKARAGELVLAGDKATATLDFTAESSAHGVSTALMEAGMDFRTPATCHAKVMFDTNARPVIADLNCVVTIQK